MPTKKNKKNKQTKNKKKNIDKKILSKTVHQWI